MDEEGGVVRPQNAAYCGNVTDQLALKVLGVQKVCEFVWQPETVDTIQSRAVAPRDEEAVLIAKGYMVDLLKLC